MNMANQVGGAGKDGVAFAGQGAIKLMTGRGPAMTFEQNGDIYIDGKKVTNDAQVVNRFRKWLDEVEATPEIRFRLALLNLASSSVTMEEAVQSIYDAFMRVAAEKNHGGPEEFETLLSAKTLERVSHTIHWGRYPNLSMAIKGDNVLASTELTAILRDAHERAMELAIADRKIELRQAFELGKKAGRVSTNGHGSANARAREASVGYELSALVSAAVDAIRGQVALWRKR
jgi:hypothetical protein